ncbi:hypothetical protein BH20ACT6_BH20ACT6_02100 [soil metagenome]
MAFLPAVWPAERRAWVVDRATRMIEEACLVGDTVMGRRSIAWSDDEYAELDNDIRDAFRSCWCLTVSARRLWLLSPPGGLTVADITDRVKNEIADDQFFASPPLTAQARRVLADVWGRPLDPRHG